MPDAEQYSIESARKALREVLESSPPGVRRETVAKIVDDCASLEEFDRQSRYSSLYVNVSMFRSSRRHSWWRKSNASLTWSRFSLFLLGSVLFLSMCILDPRLLEKPDFEKQFALRHLKTEFEHRKKLTIIKPELASVLDDNRNDKAFQWKITTSKDEPWSKSRLFYDGEASQRTLIAGPSDFMPGKPDFREIPEVREERNVSSGPEGTNPPARQSDRGMRPPNLTAYIIGSSGVGLTFISLAAIAVYAAKRDAKEKQFARLKVLVYIEVHKAICTKDARYHPDVEQFNQNAKLVVVAISGFIASSFGFPLAAVSALVGAVLVLSCKVGVNSFCEFVKEIEKVDNAKSERGDEPDAEMRARVSKKPRVEAATTVRKKSKNARKGEKK